MTAEFPLAVHALVYLLHKQCLVSSSELAENVCTNPARVRKVLAKLHRAGLVDAKRGAGSGFIALPDSGALSLARIAEALGEEPIAMGWHSGDIDKSCLISSGMAAVMDGIYESMNAVCYAKLAAITVGAVNDMIFRKGGAKHET